MSAARAKRDPSLGAGILGARVDPDAPKPGSATARRTKPTRLTVDLDPPLRRRVGSWAEAAAEELDAPRVVLADVVRALLHRLVDDDNLSEAIIAQLKDMKS